MMPISILSEILYNDLLVEILRFFNILPILVSFEALAPVYRTPATYGVKTGFVKLESLGFPVV